ncbi:MAG: DNA polymerase III subunit alpha [bacterium]|nr:DNA polymerase III subunit alpha [bacterium]
MDFVHLHAHSHYSLLDGLPKIDELVAAVKAKGMSAVALTDHGSMYGVIEFYQKATAAGIKPIIGVETYVARNTYAQKRANIDERPYHLTLLAKNYSGYRNLIKLTTVAHLEGFYRKPRIDFDLLKQYSEGLIVLSGCLSGELASHIINNNLTKAKEAIRRYQEVFGEDYFLEVQPHPKVRYQHEVNERLFQLGKEMGVATVATNDSHYIESGDAEAHDILLCIQTKRKTSDTDRMSYMTDNFGLRKAEEMAAAFPDHPEAISNSVEIANRCQLEITLGQISLPHYEVPSDQSAESYLRALCVQALPDRYGIRDPDKPEPGRQTEVIERMEFELSVIERTGFAPYFLIVQDFINWAKDQGIVVGPGRGSAAGSIISYLTRITNIDPLKYELLFERFLNPDRISMPDIDVDFADDRRDEVIRYVEKKYGKDHVAQIITFGTMAARAAVRDVGRVLGLSYAYCDRVAKLIPMFTTLDEAINAVPELKEIYENDEEGRNLLTNAKKLEGVARHASTHACGVVITKEPLENHVPVQHASQDDETIITQYSLHPIEDLGLLKMDFLGLKNLTILQNAITIIEKTRGLKVDLDNLPLDDKKTFDLLQRAQTTGVFQLESSGMKRYLKQLQPSSLEDIIAMVSLYRPGPMDLIPDFIAGKHGRKITEYLHPKLKPLLEKTYGVAVYQEQIMQIAQSLAGFTLSEADVLRKAVGKKIAALLNEQKSKFIDGCVKNDIPRPTAERIFQFIEPFARYGFNRSHGACYALIAYQTAFFKANYPEEFMAALLTSDQENIDRISVEVDEARRMGMTVLPPDVNESFATFTVVKPDSASDAPTIRFGLRAVKNVGTNIVDTIITERKSNGIYKSLEDFLSRVHTKNLNKKSLESLIKCGALDGFGERQRLLENIELMLSYAKSAERESSNGQTNFFRLAPIENSPKLKLRQTASAPKEQRLGWEKELLGLYITEHPFEEFAEIIRDATTPLSELEHVAKSSRVLVAGIVAKIQRILTKNNEQMLFVTLEDTTGSVELLVFPSVLQSNPAVWQEDRPLAVSGKLSDKDDDHKLLVDTAAELKIENALEILQSLKSASPRRRRSDRQPAASPFGTIFIQVPGSANREIYDKLKATLLNHPGQSPVYLVINRSDGQRVIKTEITTRRSQDLTQAVESLIGENSIRSN